MPRAFLITHRRYNTVVEYDNRESSPERSVSEAEHRRGSVEADTAPVTLPRGQRSPTVHSLPGHSSRPFSLESAWTTVTSASVSRRHAHRGIADENGNDCPEELYNLTKLAEVSLAAAAGHIFTPLGETPTRESSDADGLNDDDEDEDDGTRDEDDEDYSGSQRSISPRQRNTASGGVVGEYHGCPECGKRYSTSSNLARHRQTHRSLADKKARRCPHCDKVYVSMPAFSMHVRTHNQGCKCPFCGKCFSRPWLLQGHIRTHTGEKPFRCSVCDKAFADKSNLRAHVQTHSNEKPYVCGRCGKAFALKSYLYKHEESSCMRIHHHGGGPAKSLPEDKESRSLSSGKKNLRLQPVVQEQPRKLDQSTSNGVLTVIHRSEFGDVSVDDAGSRTSGRVFQVGGTESRENSPVSAVQYQEPVHQLRDDQQHVHHGAQHHHNLYVGRLHMMSPGITV